MPEYPHLLTPAFANRYVLAAHHLGRCRNIVEVGGHRLHTFMRDDKSRCFWNIDPTADQSTYNHMVSNFCMPVQDFDFTKVPMADCLNGLCLVGMEMHDETYDDGGLAALNNVINGLDRFHTIVVEICEDNRTAHRQAEILDAELMEIQFPMVLDMVLKFWHDGKYPEAQNPSFFKQRRLRVYER